MGYTWESGSTDAGPGACRAWIVNPGRVRRPSRMAGTLAGSVHRPPLLGPSALVDLAGPGRSAVRPPLLDTGDGPRTGSAWGRSSPVRRKPPETGRRRVRGLDPSKYTPGPVRASWGRSWPLLGALPGLGAGPRMENPPCRIHTRESNA